MPQVVVEIGGRNYPLSCRDGDEGHLTGLAATIADKAAGLTRSLGPMSESRLLLMAALMVADELHDARRSHDPAGPHSVAQAVVPAPPAPVHADPGAARLEALVDRAERLAASFGA